ncbi:T9SS type A sorting domain-containing protein [bacterium]|nr:T9SS type A sorting domain-containing protein [bacterium]
MQRPRILPDPDAGTVPGEDSLAVAVTIEGRHLVVGDYATGLHLIETDAPGAPRLVIPVSVHVDGSPVAIAAPGAIDFGTVDPGVPTSHPIQLANLGADTLHVQSIAASGPFTTDLVPVTLAPYEAAFGQVMLTPPGAGSFAGELTIGSDDPLHPVLTVSLAALSDLDADIAVSPPELLAAVPTDAMEADTLMIASTDAGILDWHVRIVFPHLLFDGLRVLWDRSHGQPSVNPWGTMRGYLNGYGAIVFSSTAPIDAALLATYDVLWSATPESTWTAAERTAVADWVADGGALVLEGTTDLAVTEGNALLEAIGSGTRWTCAPGAPGAVTNIRSHMVTDVFSPMFPFALPGSGAFVSESGPDATVLFDDASLRPVAVVETIGRGRVFTCLATEPLRNGTVNIGFGAGLFQWIASWITLDPVRGAVPGGESVACVATYRTTRLEPGVVSLDLRITSDAISLPLLDVPVELTVVAGPAARPAAPDAPVASGPVLPLRFRMYGGVPNPFAASTGFRFDLPRQTRSRLVVYDLAGRRLRTLVSGTLPAGRHEIRWDGRDERGRQVASGVYFYRLTTDTESVTHRVVRLR